MIYRSLIIMMKEGCLFPYIFMQNVCSFTYVVKQFGFFYKKS